LPLEVCEKSSEQNLTLTEQAIEAFKRVNSVPDFQKLIAQYPREVLVDAADLQDSAPERARARQMLEATLPQSAGVNSLEVALTASEIAEMKGFDRLILCTSQQHKRLGWTHQQAREFLIDRYGKRSKQLLTDEEMLDLYDYLKTLPTPDPSSSG
jgi:hypothetical protein